MSAGFVTWGLATDNRYQKTELIAYGTTFGLLSIPIYIFGKKKEGEVKKYNQDCHRLLREAEINKESSNFNVLPVVYKDGFGLGLSYKF